MRLAMCIGVERGIGSHEMGVGPMCGNKIDWMYNIYTSKVLIADGYPEAKKQWSLRPLFVWGQAAIVDIESNRSGCLKLWYQKTKQIQTPAQYIWV